MIGALGQRKKTSNGLGRTMETGERDIKNPETIKNREEPEEEYGFRTVSSSCTNHPIGAQEFTSIDFSSGVNAFIERYLGVFDRLAREERWKEDRESQRATREIESPPDANK